jgi:transposase
MRNFQIPNRNQQLLFAHIDLNTIAPVGSPLNVIDTLVDQLNTEEIEKRYDFESLQGREPFHPKTLIKGALYAIHNCRFSLRKIEYDTLHHLGYRWLTGDKVIDHSTLGKFLCEHRTRIVELFSRIVEIGIEKELIDFDVLAIDTVKIRANASYKRFRNTEGLEKERQKIKEKLKELVSNAEKESEAEIEVLKKRESKLEEAAAILKERVAADTDSATDSIREQILEKAKINLTDSDCALLQQANGEINSAYSITTAVDSGHDFITHFQVNDGCNDAKALMETIEGSEDQTDSAHAVVVADSGFFSMDNLEKLEEKNQKALIPDKRLEVEERGVGAKGDFDRSWFQYNKEKDWYICPCRERLEPSGRVTQNGRTYIRYMNRAACGGCKAKGQCTKSAQRIIMRDQNEKLKEKMRKDLSGKRNREIYKQRSHCVESIYGQVKHNLNFRILKRRGHDKVEMEIAMIFMLHNILKIGKKLKKAA